MELRPPSPLFFPVFTLARLLDNSFQQEVEAWIDSSIGFRGHMVRSDNQINLSLFGEISSDYSSPLVLGHQNTLFEKLYVDWMNEPCAVSDEKISRQASDLETLQSLLKTKGIALLVLLSPSKTTFYGKQIPERYLHKSEQQGCQTDSDRLLAALRSRAVSYIDGRTITERVMRTTGSPGFAKGGTHWTQFVCL
jgi:hypothetical protein